MGGFFCSRFKGKNLPHLVAIQSDQTGEKGLSEKMHQEIGSRSGSEQRRVVRCLPGLMGGPIVISGVWGAWLDSHRTPAASNTVTVDIHRGC